MAPTALCLCGRKPLKTAKNLRLLRKALWNHCDDLVGLLAEKGATVRRITFYSVFHTMNAALIDRFLNLGRDPCEFIDY